MQAELTIKQETVMTQDLAGSLMMRKFLRFKPEFNLHRIGSPHRGEVESYIASVFDKTYGAEITDFAPLLMSMECAGSVSAASGIRPAAYGPLFLEQYLDEPVEQILSQRYGQNIDRHEIFELGNLAALRPRVSQLFYLIMAGVIARTPLNYVVFAGTKQVIKSVSRLGFHVESIMVADPSRLGETARNWGSYYDCEPQVMAIDLSKSIKALSSMPLQSTLLNFYEPQISEIANLFNSVYRLG